VLLRVAVLEEQFERHETEISKCLQRQQSVADAGQLSALEATVLRLEGVVKSEQLYRQGQEFIYGARHVERDIAAGLSALKASAGLGHSGSALALSFLHSENKECGCTDSELAAFLKVCADAGDSVCQYKYGRCLETGLGVEANTSEAVKYYKLSADQGNGYGQSWYGYCLHSGIGIGQNVEEALKYYRLAVDQGNALGQSQYGFCFERGVGMAINVEEAVKYYKLSVDQGNPFGQIHYGLCLRDGIGIARNRESGERYLALARAQGVD
jgi:TPR repeat protein